MRLDESITKASDEQLQSLCNAETHTAPLSEDHFARWDIPVEIKQAFAERAKMNLRLPHLTDMRMCSLH